MNIVASLGRGLGSWLGLPSRETLGLPTAMLPTGTGEMLTHSRPVTLITAPVAPPASASTAPDSLEFTRIVTAKAVADYNRSLGFSADIEPAQALKNFRLAAEVQKQLRSKSPRPTVARPGLSAPLSATSAPDPDPIGDVIKNLEAALDTLKQLAGVPAGEEVEGEAEARAAVKAGRRGEALRLLDQTITAIGVRINDRNARRDLKGKSLVTASYREQIRSIAPPATGKPDWFASLRADAGKPSPRRISQPPAENRLKGRALVSKAFRSQLGLPPL